ncbi:hypothetical protein LBMAG42_10230 [Deltaproteobacteria bacterium]|nr:hypothetical protein LBMAG42_10230 [Deltaproteobacteria bacterium]
MSRGRLQVLAVGLLALAVVLARRGLDQTSEALVGTRTCDAVRAEDWGRALVASESLVGASEHPAGLGDAAVCRCVALEATGDIEGCNQLLDEWLLDPTTGGWLPDAPHTTRWAESRAREGRMADAASVLERLRLQHPEDAELTGRAFRLQLLADGRPETSTALEATARTLTGHAGSIARLIVAEARGERGDHAEQYALMAEFEPEPDDPIAVRYRLRRLVAAADAGNVEAVVALRDAWMALPGQRSNATLAYAVGLSMASLRDPGGQSWIDLLTPELAAPTDDDTIVRVAWERRISHLTTEGRAAEALAALEQARIRFPTLAFDADELQRVGGLGEWGRGAGESGAATLRFTANVPVAGAALYVSPGYGRPSSAAWGRFELVEGQAAVHRTLDATPVRWVYRSETSTFASGATWPTAATVDVPITVRGDGAARAIASDLGPGTPADGHRRVWVLFLDCGDWRLTSYLRQRGELPNLDGILRTGWRATTRQDPAFTAAAVEGLLHPELRRSRSTLARINQLGLELAGLESIGQNPFAPLERLLPLQPDLFQRLGRGEHRAANLIFAHGAIDGGRNGSVTGPQGAESSLALGAMKRPLTDAEAARFPLLVATGEPAAAMRSMIGVIAAQFDTLLAFEEDPPFDLLLFRIEALDPLTHQYFTDTTHTGQDDGAAGLFETYRYIDSRLGEVARRLDGDDMLIVMSDHGIQTSMVHDPIAMFVAWGNGVPAGRVIGTPALRGLSRGLADLLGETTGWPDYGLLPWAEQWRAGQPILQTEAAALNPEAAP